MTGYTVSLHFKKTNYLNESFTINDILLFFCFGMQA